MIRLVVRQSSPQGTSERPARSFLGDYLRNLALTALVLGAMALFLLVFYPETLQVFAAVGFFFTLLKFWPFIILALLIALLPRRR